jgi:hypothetical protein
MQFTCLPIRSNDVRNIFYGLLLHKNIWLRASKNITFTQTDELKFPFISNPIQEMQITNKINSQILEIDFY